MLILKSKSPRRMEILKSLGFQFLVEPSLYPEEQLRGEAVFDYLKRVTLGKLEMKSNKPGNTYLSSDTIVVYNQQILQKPLGPEEAFQMLKLLSGNIHSVYSGLGIRTEEDEIFYEYDKTDVYFKPWTNEEINYYVENYRPFDKAGAYGIQDRESPVGKYEGSYMNVVGLPLRKFFLFIEKLSKYID